MTTQSTKTMSPSVVLLWILGLILISCSRSPAAPAPSSPPALTPAPGTYWPTEAWRTSTPEAQGMDPSKLAEMMDQVEQQGLNWHSLLIIRNGYIVSETYFEPYRQDTKHELYSCTKSFVATLIGIAIDRGEIERTDQPVVDFFSELAIANREPQKESMTLENVLTMQTGLDWQEGDPAYRELYQSADWVQYMLDRPMAQEPGSQFNYCSGCSHLLSAILHQATGANPRAYAEQHLFKPLGISDFRWDVDAEGVPIGGWGLQLAARDMAKLGYLYLREGKWDGQQILSAGWVKAATQRHTETDGPLGYGYQWWIYPDHGAYAALGRYGQTIFVIPESDLIVVTTAGIDNHDAVFQLIEDYVLPAVQE